MVKDAAKAPLATASQKLIMASPLNDGVFCVFWGAVLFNPLEEELA